DHGVKADSSDDDASIDLKIPANPDAGDVADAQVQYDQARHQSDVAEKEAEHRAARAAAAKQRAESVSYGLRGHQAALNASAEAVLADRAKSKAEVMHLRAVVASEKVQLVQLSLRQAQGASPQTTAEYMAGGGAFVGCLALLVFYAIDVKRRMEPQLKELSEPLAPQSPYQAPEWTRGDVAGDATAEEWQQRARAAQEAAARSKAASDALREAATVRLSDAQEQLSAATRRAEKAEAAAGKSAAEAKSCTETAATAHVAAQKAREEAEQFSEGATQ
ncbi:unnamed protein product, partial [Polarella glacialis]